MMAPDPKLYEHLSNKDRMLQGFPYDNNTEELIAGRNRAKRLTKELNALDGEDMERKVAILQELFNPNSGKRLEVEPNFRVDYGSNITAGENFFMNYDGCILDVCPVKIGKNFLAGPSVHIYTATHPINAHDRLWWEYGKPVTIGDGVWVGGLSVICPGVTIGDGVVVGAGSVVTKDVPEYVVVAGNPARIIKHLEKPKKDE